MRIRVVDNEEDFFALRKRWEALHFKQKVRLLDHSFYYVASAWTAVWQPKGCRLHVLVGERDGDLVLVLPLVLERKGPLRIGHSLGPGYYEYCDFLLDPYSATDECVSMAWRMAAKYFHVFRFQAIREDSKLWAFVKGARAKEWIDTRAPYIDCTQWPDWNAYVGSRSSKFRRDTGRLRRRLEAAGEVRFEIISDLDQVSEVNRWMLEKKLEWFARAEAGPDAMALFLEKTAFFVSLCNEGCRSGELMMTVLYVGDVRVAAVLGFMLGDRFIAQMLAWDFTWEPSGPGRLTLEDAIRWGLEHRAKTIDLGLGTKSISIVLQVRT